MKKGIISVFYAIQPFSVCMYALERKFAKNPNFKLQYTECIQNYIDEGHLIVSSNNEVSEQGYYLPHHIKECSVTTKTRVVFDGSAKTSTGISLNDTLLVGSTIQEDLFSIVVRFRSFLYARTADIQQMYRQICVDPEDSILKKILWRSTPIEPIKTYELNRVTFGTACAPFFAILTLNQLADDEQKAHPVASKHLKCDFYVGDRLAGAQTFQGALELRNELRILLEKGGFNLRKWTSNESNLINDFSAEISSDRISLDPSETIKTLVINSENDGHRSHY